MNVNPKLSALVAVIGWSVLTTMFIGLMFKADSYAIISPKADLLVNAFWAAIGIITVYCRSRELLK